MNYGPSSHSSPRGTHRRRGRPLRRGARGRATARPRRLSHVFRHPPSQRHDKFVRARAPLFGRVPAALPVRGVARRCAGPVSLRVDTLEEVQRRVGCLGREEVAREEVAVEALARAKGGVGNRLSSELRAGRCDQPATVGGPALVLCLNEWGAEGVLVRDGVEAAAVLASGELLVRSARPG